MQLIVFTVDPTEIIPKKNDLFNFGSWVERSFIFLLLYAWLYVRLSDYRSQFLNTTIILKEDCHIGTNKFFVLVKSKQQFLGDSSNAVYLCNSCHQTAHELFIMR